jgi:hypothetical protein
MYKSQTGNYYNKGEAILFHGNVKRQCFIVSVKETANTDGAWFWAITNGRKINILVNHFPMNSPWDNKLTNYFVVKLLIKTRCRFVKHHA